MDAPSDIPYIVKLFALREGFGASATNLPTRQNNPMDLMHAPGETHPADAPNSIGSFATPQEGWAAALEQCQKWAARGLTVAQAVTTEAPPADNDTAAYITFICGRVGCSPDTLMSDALNIQGPSNA